MVDDLVAISKMGRDSLAAVNPEAPNSGVGSDFQSLRPGHAKDLPRTGVEQGVTRRAYVCQDRDS